MTEVLKTNNMDTQKNYDWSDKVILIAEDVETSNRYYKAALSRTNAKLLWAKNGKEAFDLVDKNKKIDIILMDLHMPELNGFKATRKIKDLKRDIPIIVQTAYILAGEEEMCYEAGCDEFLAKPVKFNTLLTTIKKYF